MNNLDENQKKALITHMNQNEDDNWVQHANWVWWMFGVRITPDECAKLMMESIFA